MSASALVGARQSRSRAVRNRAKAAMAVMVLTWFQASQGA
jgi:hypothetical protein